MTAAIRRIRTVLGDHYDSPKVDLYPPRADDPPPVPPRDEPMYSARYLLAENGRTVKPSPGRHRRPVMPGMALLSRARFVVPLLLTAMAVMAVLAGCKPSGAAEQPPAPATTGPTPSPLGLSVADDSPAAFVAELLDVHKGSAIR